MYGTGFLNSVQSGDLMDNYSLMFHKMLQRAITLVRVVSKINDAIRLEKLLLHQFNIFRRSRNKTWLFFQLRNTDVTEFDK